MRRYGPVIPVALLLFAAACSGDGDEAAPTRTGPKSQPSVSGVAEENLSLICDGHEGFAQAAAYAGTQHPMQVFDVWGTGVTVRSTVGFTSPAPWGTWAQASARSKTQLIGCVAEDQPSKNTGEPCSYLGGPIRDLHERPVKIGLHVVRTGRKLADVVIQPPDDPECPSAALAEEEGPVFSVPAENAVIKALEKYAYGPVR